MSRPRILITGFGPFPGAPDNSSAWLAESLAATHSPSRPEYDLRAEVLPTEWDKVGSLGPKLTERHRPRLILHLGLSKRAREFRIERSAHNLIDPREDARGTVLGRRTILDCAERRLDTTIPASRLAKHLRMQDLPAVASRSAGTYLCNYLYYLSLHQTRRQDAACDVCFVHLPPGPHHGGPLSEAELLRGAELIVRYLLAFAMERDRAETSDDEIGRAVHAEPMPG